MGALWKIFKEALDLPKGEQYDDSSLMDISPPEFENWSPTERMRKRLPLKYQPEDDDSFMFFEKGLHQTINTPESERPLTPYGSQSLAWKVVEDYAVKLEEVAELTQYITGDGGHTYKDGIYTQHLREAWPEFFSLFNLNLSYSRGGAFVTYDDIKRAVLQNNKKLAWQSDMFDEDENGVFWYNPRSKKDMQAYNKKLNVERKRRQLLLEQELPNILKGITYQELPEYVRSFFENEFGHIFKQVPEAYQYVTSLTVDMRLHHGKYGDWAEYFKDDNRIEFYKEWHWDTIIYKLMDSAGIENPEEIRKYFINKYLNRTIVHELVHSLQHYFETIGTQHHFVAPYPDEEHPDYYKHKDFYKQDPGEIQAYDVGDSFEYPEDVNKQRRKDFGFNKYYSLDKSSWKVQPNFVVYTSDWPARKILAQTKEKTLFIDNHTVCASEFGTHPSLAADPGWIRLPGDFIANFNSYPEAYEFAWRYASERGIGLLLDKEKETLRKNHASLKFADPLTYTDKSDVSDGSPFKDRALMFHTEEATDIDNPPDTGWIEQEPNFFPAPSNENEIAQLDRDDNTILNNENKRKKTLTWQTRNLEMVSEFNDKIIYLYNPTVDRIEPGMMIRLKGGDGEIVKEVDTEKNSVLVGHSIGGTLEHWDWHSVDDVDQVWKIGSYEYAMDLMDRFNGKVRDTVNQRDTEASLKLSSDDPSFDDYDNRDNTRHRNDFFKYDTDEPGGEDALDMQDRYYEDLMYKKDTEKEYKERNALDWTGRENLQLGFGSLKLGWQFPYTIKVGDRVKVEHPQGYVVIDLIREDPIDEPDRGLYGQVLESNNPYWDKYQMFYLPKDVLWPVTKIASLKQSWKIHTEPKFMKEYRFYIDYEDWQFYFLDDNGPPAPGVEEEDHAAIVRFNDEMVAADDAWSDFVRYCLDITEQDIIMHELSAEVGEPDLQDADDAGKTCDIEVTADAKTHVLLFSFLSGNRWFKSSHNVESSLKLSWDTFLSRIGDIKEGDIIIDDGNDKYRILRIDHDSKTVKLEEVFPSGNFDGPFWIDEDDMIQHGFEKVSWKIVDDAPKKGDRVRVIADDDTLIQINLDTNLLGGPSQIGIVVDIIAGGDWANEYSKYNDVKRLCVKFDARFTWKFPYTLWRDFFEIVEGGATTASFQKESWGPSRRVWVSFWAIGPDTKLNPSDVQQNWTVVMPLLETFESIDQITGIIKEKLRNHLKKEYPDAFTSGYFWGSMRMWALNSENIEFLDKYFTEEEIKKLKEDTILIVDKKPFPIEVNSPLTSLN